MFHTYAIVVDSKSTCARAHIMYGAERSFPDVFRLHDENIPWPAEHFKTVNRMAFPVEAPSWTVCCRTERAEVPP